MVEYWNILNIEKLFFFFQIDFQVALLAPFAVSFSVLDFSCWTVSKNLSIDHPLKT